MSNSSPPKIISRVFTNYESVSITPAYSILGVSISVCPRRTQKCECVGAKRKCSSTFALRTFAFGVPALKSKCATMRNACSCSSTFAFCALANVPIAYLVLSTFALSHQHFALLGSIWRGHALRLSQSTIDDRRRW